MHEDREIYLIVDIDQLICTPLGSTVDAMTPKVIKGSLFLAAPAGHTMPNAKHDHCEIFQPRAGH